MKKFISLFLCIVLISFAFTACKQTVIGEDLQNREDNKDKNTTLETLNMYVIVDDDTADQAKETVPTNINVYLKETYKVQLNIVYCKATEYEKTVTDKLADGVAEADRPDIILINSVEMFNAFHSAGYLAPLTSFYNDRDYQKLNAIVEDKLLASSLVTEVIPGADGASDTYVSDYYTVPNNHRIGEYKYIVIDKAQARDKLHYSSSKIAAMNDERALAEYKSQIGESFVSLVKGNYETMLYLEYGYASLEELQSDIAEYYLANKADPGVDVNSDDYKNACSAFVQEYTKIVLNSNEYKVNFVNIASYPNATKTEAFSSAYAVIKSLNDVGKLSEEEEAAINNHYSKCVDIIYALNNDPQLRNMLQYGYVGTNYNFVKDEKHQNTNYITLRGEAISTNPVYYGMNLSYTGNPYIAYYCEQQGWTAEVHANVLKQNAASYTLLDKVNEESSYIKDTLNNYVLDLTDASEDRIVLWDNGVKHGDVTIEWSTSSENVLIYENMIVLAPLVAPISEIYTEEMNVEITAVLTCVDEASGESETCEVVINLILVKATEAPEA